MEEGGADVPLKRIEIDTEEESHLGLQEKDSDSALLSESEHEETYFDDDAEGSSDFNLNQDDLSLTIEPIKSGSFEVIGNIFKSFVGAGILGLPFGFLKAGLWVRISFLHLNNLADFVIAKAGLVTLLLVGIVSNYTIKLLVRCKYQVLLDRKAERLSKGTEGIPLEEIGSTEAGGGDPGATAESRAEKLINGGDDDDVIVGGVDELGQEDERDEEKELTYADVGRAALGRWGSWLVNFAVISSQFGFCCSYVIYIGENLSSVVEVLGVGQAILVCCPIFLLLSWVRTLKWIGWLSNIANLALVLAIVVIAYYGISHYDTWDINLLSSVISWDTYPLSFGLFVFAFEGINLALPIESSMKRRERYNWHLDGTMAVVGVLYILFGMSGFIFFGKDTKDVITLNLPANVMVSIVKICLCLELLGSYPIQLYPVLETIELAFFARFGRSLYDNRYPSHQLNDDYAESMGVREYGMVAKMLDVWEGVKQSILSKETWVRNLLRLGVASGTVAVALFVPFFGSVSNLVGAFSNSLAAFILPPLLLLKIFTRQRLALWEWSLNLVIFVGGILVSFICSGVTLVEIVYKLTQ